MERLNPSGLLTLDFADLAACADRVAAFSASHPIGAVVGVDEAKRRLGGPRSPRAWGSRSTRPQGRAAARHKRPMREPLAATGVPSPRHRVVGPTRIPAPLRARSLSLRGEAADAHRQPGRDPRRRAGGIRGRVARVAAHPRHPHLRAGSQGCQAAAGRGLRPRPEVAVEALLTGRACACSRIFDKPDPLAGPFFEETLYVTPSRLARGPQASRAIAGTARGAGARAPSTGRSTPSCASTGERVPVDRARGALDRRPLLAHAALRRGPPAGGPVLRHALGLALAGAPAAPRGGRGDDDPHPEEPASCRRSGLAEARRGAGHRRGDHLGPRRPRPPAARGR